MGQNKQITLAATNETFESSPSLNPHKSSLSGPAVWRHQPQAVSEVNSGMCDPLIPKSATALRTVHAHNTNYVFVNVENDLRRQTMTRAKKEYRIKIKAEKKIEEGNR